ASSLKLLRATVHRAAENAQVSLEVSAAEHEGVVTGIDAGRSGLQPEIAVRRADKERGVGDVAGTIGGHGGCAAIVEGAGPIVIGPTGPRIRIDNAILKRG